MWNYSEQSENNEKEKIRQYRIWKMATPWHHEEIQNLYGDSYNWFLEHAYQPVETLDRKRPQPRRRKLPTQPTNGMSKPQAIQHDLYKCRNLGGATAKAHNAAMKVAHNPCPHCSLELHDPAQGCGWHCHTD